MLRWLGKLLGWHGSLGQVVVECELCHLVDERKHFMQSPTGYVCSVCDETLSTEAARMLRYPPDFDGVGNSRFHRRIKNAEARIANERAQQQLYRKLIGRPLPPDPQFPLPLQWYLTKDD